MVLGQTVAVNSPAPPASNTGAQNTHHLDWLSYTAPDSVDPWDAFPLIPFSEWRPLPRAAMGYAIGWAAGSARVYTKGNAGMGTHVVISGSALLELEQTGRVESWREYVEWLRHRGWNIARLDWAIDDHQGLVTYERIKQALNGGLLTSRFKKWREISGALIARSYIGTGWTIEFGSRSSRAYCRIYDKAAERAAATNSRRALLEAVSEHWVRVEYEFKDERANEVADAWLSRGPGFIASIMLGYLHFREEHVGRNTSRAPSAPWWVELLNVTRSTPLHARRVTPSVVTAERWLGRQVAPTISALIDGRDGEIGWLYELVTAGRLRYREKHRALIAEGRALAA